MAGIAGNVDGAPGSAAPRVRGAQEALRHRFELTAVMAYGLLEQRYPLAGAGGDRPGLVSRRPSTHAAG